MTSAKKSFAHLVTRRWDGTDPGVTEAVQRFGREGEGRWGWGGDKQGLGSEDCGFSPSIATTKIAWGPNCNLRYPQLSISGLLLGKLGYAPTAEEVLRKVCQRDIASVPAKNGTSLSFSRLWVQIRVLAQRVGAETAPGRTSHLRRSFPISSRGNGALPPPQPRLLPARSSHPSHSPFPFRPLPGRACASPRQDRVPRLPVQKSRQGSHRAEEKTEWRE